MKIGSIVDSDKTVVTVYCSEIYCGYEYKITKTAGVTSIEGLTRKQIVDYMIEQMTEKCNQKIMEDIKNSVIMKEV
jgi:hypothetical protein